MYQSSSFARDSHSTPLVTSRRPLRDIEFNTAVHRHQTTKHVSYDHANEQTQANTVKPFISSTLKPHHSSTPSTRTRPNHTPSHTLSQSQSHHQSLPHLESPLPSALPVSSSPSSIPSPRVTLMERALTFHGKPTVLKPRALECVRLLALEDGSMFGSWSDGVSILMHPQATTMTQLLPDGTMCRQVTALVGSGAKEKIVELLSFRNVISEQPVLDEAFWTGSTRVEATSYPFARWGLQPGSALEATAAITHSGEPTSTLYSTSTSNSILNEAPTVMCPARRMSDGSVVIEAMEGGISLTLLPNQRWVRLSYPIPLKRQVAGVSSEGIMRYEYTYAEFKQLFPIEDVPKRWRFPLQSALLAALQQPPVDRHDSCHNINAFSSSQSSPSADLPSTPPRLTDAPFDTPISGLPSHIIDTTKSRPQESFTATSPLASNRRQESPFLVCPSPAFPPASHFDLVMDLPVVRSLHPSSVSGPPKLPLHRAFIEPCGPTVDTLPNADLTWPDNPAHSASVLHSSATTLPKDSLVRTLWTKQAFFTVQVDRKRVVMLVHEDQSAIVLEANGFFYHYLEPLTQDDINQAAALAAAAESTENFNSAAINSSTVSSILQIPVGLVREKVYAPGLAPTYHNASGLNIGERRYPLADICATALRLQSHAVGVLEQRELDSKEAERKLRSLIEQQPGCELTPADLADLRISPLHPHLKAPVQPFSTALHDRSIVRNVGEFFAFQDGRIKVRFVDRCLCQINAARTEANLLLPNGFPVRITIPSKEADEYQRSEGGKEKPKRNTNQTCSTVAHGHHIQFIAFASISVILRYIRPTVEFSVWAYQTPAEREEQQR